MGELSMLTPLLLLGVYSRTTKKSLHTRICSTRFPRVPRVACHHSGPRIPLCIPIRPMRINCPHICSNRMLRKILHRTKCPLPDLISHIFSHHQADRMDLMILVCTARLLRLRSPRRACRAISWHTQVQSVIVVFSLKEVSLLDTTNVLWSYFSR